MALGARQADVLRMVLQQSSSPMVCGTALGLAGAFALTRLMNSMLYEVSATDPWIFSSVTGILLTTALAAAFFPARQAARIDPLVALRHD